MNPLDRLRVFDAGLADRISVSDGGCWLVGGAPARGGYIQIRRHGTRMQAHRRTYQLLRDESFDVNPGHSDAPLDHICGQPRCCNPWHLEPTTRRGNSATGKRGVRGDHTSNLIGVRLNARESKWQTTIGVLKRQRHLGMYVDESVAGQAYDAACLLIGEPPLNHQINSNPLPTDAQIADAFRRLQKHQVPQSQIAEAIALRDTFTARAVA